MTRLPPPACPPAAAGDPAPPVGAGTLRAFPLRLAPRPSRFLAVALAAAHSGAALLLWVSAAPRWTGVAGTLLLGASFCFHWLRDARLRLPRSIICLVLDRERDGALRCEFTQGDGRRVAGPVLGSSVVLPWLVVLGIRPAGSRRARRVTLLADSLSAGAFRALRVALRWGYADEMRREPDAGRVS